MQHVGEAEVLITLHRLKYRFRKMDGLLRICICFWKVMHSDNRKENHALAC